MTMYRVRAVATGIPLAAGPNAAIEIAEEFTHRPWQTNVQCSWDGDNLFLQADNDFDQDGRALLDEFSDAIAACLRNAGDGKLALVSVTEISSAK